MLTAVAVLLISTANLGAANEDSRKRLPKWGWTGTTKRPRTTAPASQPTSFPTYYYEPGKTYYHTPNCGYLKKAKGRVQVTPSLISDRNLKPCLMCLRDLMKAKRAKTHGRSSSRSRSKKRSVASASKRAAGLGWSLAKVKGKWGANCGWRQSRFKSMATGGIFYSALDKWGSGMQYLAMGPEEDLTVLAVMFIRLSADDEAAILAKLVVACTIIGEVSVWEKDDLLAWVSRVICKPGWEGEIHEIRRGGQVSVFCAKRGMVALSAQTDTGGEP